MYSTNFNKLREDLEPSTIIFSNKSKSNAAAFFRDLYKVRTIRACTSCYTSKKGYKEVSFLILNSLLPSISFY